MTRYSLALLRMFAVALLLLVNVTCSRIAVEGDRCFVLSNPSGRRVRVDPYTLGLWTQIPGLNQEFELSSQTLKPQEIVVTERGTDRLSWRIPSRALTVELRLGDSELSARFTTEKEQDLEWPVTGLDPQAVAAIIPRNEGLYIPVKDEFWLRRLGSENCYTAHGGISMPFWGIQFQESTVTYILLEDIASSLCLRNQQGTIEAVATHLFSRRENFLPYEVKIVFSGNSPIAPAKVYRDFLLQSGQHVSFGTKVRANPEARKLLGALHIYLWGDGRLPEAISQIRDLGIERALLLYDQDPRSAGHLVTPEAIRLAKSLGFIIGPYDIYDNIQDPAESDSFTSAFDDSLYQTGAVIEKSGSRKIGFWGRGYQLSSEALKSYGKPFLEDRVDAFLREGINGYFLDVDASGELTEDFDTHHPMTKSQDRENRLQRMGFVTNNKRLVLGSENAAGWSTGVLHFSHGSETPQTQAYWDLFKQRHYWGTWSPSERPEHFFKTIDASADLVTAEFNPQYRLPLYQVAFHDSIVATDRWEASMMKFRGLFQIRSLLLLLYNVPTIWDLDQQDIGAYGETIRSLYAFFSPIHRLVGDRPLTGFQWLTADKLVQQTEFDGEIVMTANFSQRPYREIAPRCIEVIWLKNKRREVFCPEAM